MRTRETNSSAASGSFSPSRNTCRASSSEVSLDRLVIKTRHFDSAGSRGRTCSALTTLSRTSSRLRPRRQDRYTAARSSGSSGIRSRGTSSARNILLCMTVEPAIGTSTPHPRRSRNKHPSTNPGARRCAQRTASSVLPIPPMPDITQTPPATSRALRTARTSAVLPANTAAAAGSSYGRRVERLARQGELLGSNAVSTPTAPSSDSHNAASAGFGVAIPVSTLLR